MITFVLVPGACHGGNVGHNVLANGPDRVLALLRGIPQDAGALG
jgi:hypothetical protein